MTLRDDQMSLKVRRKKLLAERSRLGSRKVASREWLNGKPGAAERMQAITLTDKAIKDIDEQIRAHAIVTR